MALIEMVLWLQQGLDTRVADVVQGLIAIGVVTLIGLVIHLERRMGTIETVLTRPTTGLEAVTSLLRQRSHDHENKLLKLDFKVKELERDVRPNERSSPHLDDL